MCHSACIDNVRYADYDAGTIRYSPRPGELALSLSAILGTVPSLAAPTEAAVAMQSPEEATMTSPGAVAVLSMQPGVQRVRISNLRFQHLTWLEPSALSG